MINKVIKLFEQEELQVLQKYCDNKLAEGTYFKDYISNTPAMDRDWETNYIWSLP